MVTSYKLNERLIVFHLKDNTVNIEDKGRYPFSIRKQIHYDNLKITSKQFNSDNFKELIEFIYYLNADDLPIYNFLYGGDFIFSPIIDNSGRELLDVLIGIDPRQKIIMVEYKNEKVGAIDMTHYGYLHNTNFSEGVELDAYKIYKSLHKAIKDNQEKIKNNLKDITNE